MTCPVTGAATAPRPPTSNTPAKPPPTHDAPPESDVVEQFDRVSRSVFIALFAAGLYDQAMLPAVAAALEHTRRIRNDPIGRALRTAASEQIMFAADEQDRRAEARRLLLLHRDVKGVGPEGLRYSALNPESWNWIMISTFFVHRGTFIALTGTKPTKAENQAIWNRYRDLTADLHLPGRGAGLIEDYDELFTYYGRMVVEKLQTTRIARAAVKATLRPTRPESLPAMATPLWAITGPIIGHVIAVLGFGIMQPAVRELVPMTWTRRHDTEFKALTKLLGLGYRWLPRRVTETPLARNRRQYERIVARYNGIGLASFAPEAGGGESSAEPTPRRVKRS